LGGTVTLEIHWDGGASGLYTASLDNNGFAHGTTYDTTRARVNQAAWDSETPLGCKHPPAPPEKFAFAALAYSPYDNVWGTAINRARPDEAESAAMKQCVDHQGAQCTLEGSAKNGCVALAAVHAEDATPDPYFSTTGKTPNEALDGAEGGLAKR